MKNELTYIKNTIDITFSSLSDGLTSDFLTAWVINSALGNTSLNNPDKAAQCVILGAFNYTLRHVCRGKTLNPNIENEHAVPVLLAGIFAGAVKYGARYILNTDSFRYELLLATCARGAFNIFLYEYFRESILKAARANTDGFSKMQTLSPIFMVFEGLDCLLSEYIKHCFDPDHKPIDFLKGTAIGAISGAAISLSSIYIGSPYGSLIKNELIKVAAFSAIASLYNTLDAQKSVISIPALIITGISYVGYNILSNSNNEKTNIISR